MEKKVINKTLRRNRIDGVFDVCKYKGCSNRRFSKSGIRVYRFPTREADRLMTWIRHAGNETLLKWSSAMLRQAGLCGDHFSDDSFYHPDRMKLKPGSVPVPYEESCLETIAGPSWDHTYCKELAKEEIIANRLHVRSEKKPRQYKRLHKVANKTCNLDKVKNECCKGTELQDCRPPWRSNLTFMRTYSRKLSFKDKDDSLEWTAIEPGCPKDNVGELRASEALKQTVAKIKTATVDALVEEQTNKEIRELRTMNVELRRQNKILRIENFKLQLRLATATQTNTER